ncbi:MAG: pyruvate kinase [Deltaproteobacteria bacterium]|jgi:pyruvate kinase|nr:pyruvate kinase [Deltaproteobacteria bacterium]MBW2500466.1 pyruvate kinase [Deltaproteobacteria bacterium]
MSIEQLRSTKVVATIGPACSSLAAIRGLIEAGLNVARLNLSHGDHAGLGELAGRVRRAADEVGANVALMADTKGPEIRTGPLAEESIRLTRGADFRLFTEERVGDERGVSVNYAGLARDVSGGVSIFLDDGTLELEVVAKDEAGIDCKVVRGGELGAHKGVSVPGAEIGLPTLSAADLEDLRFVAGEGFDYLAASFVRSAQDVEGIREVLAEHDAEIPIIAKIETRQAVEDLDAIIASADGSMVARGDLGVEIPVEQVPIVQKRIIRSTVMAGKPVITATQMLDSMLRNPRPTRAEASDVANAIFDGTSAVMLSGETASGRYPTESVRTMGAIAREAEKALGEFGYLQQIHPEPRDRVTDAVAHAASEIASRTGAAAILTLTETGNTSRAISKYRPRCPIIAISSSPRVVRRLALNWGVTGAVYEGRGNDEAKVAFGVDVARRLGVEPGDVLVVTAGISRASGSTNLVRVVRP